MVQRKMITTSDFYKIDEEVAGVLLRFWANWNWDHPNLKNERARPLGLYMLRLMEKERG